MNMKKLTLFLMGFAMLFVLASCTSKVLVTFDSDGGTECESIEVDAGVKITLPADPTKDGYVFVGWFVDGKEFDPETIINKNIVLTAKWEAIMYSITYEIGEGANLSASAPKEFAENKGEEVVLPKPTKSGFLFTGWYENGVLVEKLTENKDYNLVASWEEADTLEVIFMVEGVAYETLSVFEGDVLANYDLPVDPVKEDYRFDGWYLGENKYDVENAIIMTDLELTAKFTQVKKVVAYAVSLPNSFVAYNSNKANKGGVETEADQQNEFFVWNESYMVGDDNNWVMKPIVTFVKFDLDASGNIVIPESGEPEEVTPKSWEYEIVIYQYNPTTDKYDILVDNNDKTIIDSIDYINCAINFADSASNEERAYQVKVTPKGLTENQTANKDKYTISFNIEVVDGFNAYNAKDLAYVNGVRTDYFTDKLGNKTYFDEAWNEFKEANGLVLNYNPTRVILHNNIKITKDDLPSAFFYSAEEAAQYGANGVRDYHVKDANGNIVETIKVTIEGSLKDYTYLYRRYMSANESFSLNGNYYQLDVSSMPLVVLEDGDVTAVGEVIDHSAVFKFSGDSSNHVEMKNLNFLGNANRSEIAIKGGGIILVKVEGLSATFNNNISRCFFITYFPEFCPSDAPVLVNKCKAYDAFNSFIYNWGTKALELRDCEMIGSGGPIIIQDHVYPTNSDGGIPSSAKITNCTLEAYVAGTEGWFTLVGATTIVPSIKATNDLFVPFGRSFLKSNTESGETYMNLILVNKSGDAQSITAQKVKGAAQIVDEEKDLNYTFDYGTNNPYLAAMLDNTFAKTATFETSAGGFAYVGASGSNTVLLDAAGNVLSQASQATNAIYQGDYLTLYYNGMAVVLGYYTAGATYTTA